MIAVLLVDDDESNRITLSALLEDEGFAVDVAASCAEARRRFEAGRYDLVILDQRLGDGTGSDLLPEVRARLPGARVVAVSGSAGDAPAVRAGFDARLDKGTSFPEVARALHAVLAGGGVSRG